MLNSQAEVLTSKRNQCLHEKYVVTLKVMVFKVLVMGTCIFYIWK